ncbi:hypothetical protein [Chromobacterium sp. IIBBL 290-4]|uniref:hypothetical protein n=1 Tax=Chromobacterium sp. IIBBL 290-4 TaxID=2953890 RepID=UPI0020B69353|nr:hypothetical protein [Chromobacterium sp. IIBBL 290-4]UTH75192.1 hypothetical protein NKT35_03580 [Chromobacterium sp. IIBBL 290-4]
MSGIKRLRTPSWAVLFVSIMSWSGYGSFHFPVVRNAPQGKLQCKKSNPMQEVKPLFLGFLLVNPAFLLDRNDGRIQAAFLAVQGFQPFLT